MPRFTFERLRPPFNTFEILEDGKPLGFIDYAPTAPKGRQWRCLIQGRAQFFITLVELETILKERRW